MTPELIDTVRTWIDGAKRIVVLTGAGISTDSGIPDFRGPNGVWTKNPAAEKLSSLEHYMNDPALRVLAWQTRTDHPAWNAKPNAAHIALAEMQRAGAVGTIVTQNIDGLHQMAGAKDVIEIHGTMREVVCMSCGERAPMQRALDRVRAGEEDPACRTCGGILKSATISFGQSLVAEDLIAAENAAANCTLFLSIGTSLGVYPAALLPRVAIEVGARHVIINAELTPYDADADAVIRDPIGEVVPQLAVLATE